MVETNEVMILVVRNGADGRRMGRPRPGAGNTRC